jgi:hypothetical protein
MTAPRHPDDRDPLSAYADGDPGAVRAGAPREPSDAQWEAVRVRIHARVKRAHEPAPRRSIWFRVGVAAAAALVAAAAGAWVAVHFTAPRENPQPQERVKAGPAPSPQSQPVADEVTPDPLAGFAVLPMASADDVVLHRVPGDGWLPVGDHPLAGGVSLATADDVRLDDPDESWPDVAPAPGFAPMIFAAKPR